MRFLICGIGSIGQRHYKNLQALGHGLAVFRSGRNRGYNAAFLEKFFKEEKNAGRPVRTFWDLEEAFGQFNPDAVFVTNPNAQHLDTALPSARAAKHLFIEKPVSHDLAYTAELLDLEAKHGLKIMVGYNLRFHPLLKRMKELFESGAIGSALAAQVEMGENIEDWHPWEDYRRSYAPWRKAGGGVALCFSHDIDYLYWFLGIPEKVQAAGGKMTPLDGDAEDMIKSLWEFPSGAVASLHLDYWQRPPRRVFEILGTEGKLMWDYYAGILGLVPHKKDGKAQIWKAPESFNRNDMFMEEVKDFIAAIRQNRKPAITLQEGIEVLKIALEITRQLKI